MIILAENKLTKWHIAKKTGLSPSEEYAISEFVSLFEEISGAEIRILEYRESAPNQIIIGGENIAGLGNDGFEISASEDLIKIVGSPVRGTLYGVYSFFEDYLGCRWFTHDVKVIPKRSTVEIPEIERRTVPVLEYRESFFTDMFQSSAAAPNKCNGASCRLEEKHGGKIAYHGFVHTFFPMVPPNAYFEKHPEYYSEIDGVRKHEHAQLCLSNPEVLAIVIEKVKEGFRKDPNAKIASVSQNDWHGYCECEKCSAVDREEGSPAGSVLRFVNAVAEAVEDEFPDRYIDTLAYQYTRKAPLITKPRKNVIIRLCSIECCFAHSFETCTDIQKDGKGRNSSFVDDMKAWAKIADNIYVWDYVVDFSHYLMPFPNFNVLKDNINFFIRHNVKGIFEQGCYTTRFGEMNALRGYVLAKLLWDPSYDVDFAINEFLTGYFGMAAPSIRRYIDTLHAAAAPNTADGQHFGIFISPPESFFTPELLDTFDELFDRAEMMADDDEVLKRVKTERLAPDYVRMYLCKDPELKRTLIEDYFARAKDLGVTRVNEWQDIELTKEAFIKALDEK